ncbi:IS200/IS605 family transposase [Larkinella bovis]|uniref:IS200/IS605 family transposase n=1 Tax=Larkinella bovis TaxID=683041 RepID=A0ABW0IIA1_9BACT
MSHSKTKTWIHAVFSTKNRQPLIRKTVRRAIHQLIRQQLIDQSCYLDSLNSVDDHVHLLFLLNPQRLVAEVVKHVKGSSSHEINRQNLIPEQFVWQTGYGAFSGSESQVERVRQYIAHQEEHHQKLTFAEEYHQFLNFHGLSGEENGEVGNR